MHAGDPHQWLPLTHRYIYRPNPPNLAKHAGPTVETDWSVYFAWVGNDLSYRERTENNVLLFKGTANVISTDAAVTYLKSPHRVGHVECAALLFYDMPVVKAGSVVGSEVYILAYDLLKEKFFVVWFKECPLNLGELAAGWKEKGTEMCRCDFQEVVRLLDDRKLAEDVSPSWKEDFGPRALPEWDEELGLKVCALLFITQFVLDFQGPFDLQPYRVWHLQALLTSWRRRVARWWFSTKQTTAPDLPDPGLSSGSDPSPVDAGFNGREGSPDSSTYSFGNPYARRELIASLKSFTLTSSRGNTYKKRPEQCIYDEEDEEGWGALQNWAATQQTTAVGIAQSEATTHPSPQGSKFTGYVPSSDEGVSPNTMFAKPYENMPSNVLPLQLDKGRSPDAEENNDCTAVNTIGKTSLEGNSVIAMADALKKLLAERPSLDSAENQKKMKEFLAQLFDEAKVNPLEVPSEITESTEPHTDGEGDRQGLAAVKSAQHSLKTEEANGSMSDGNTDGHNSDGTESVSLVVGPHRTVWVVPDETVKVLP